MSGIFKATEHDYISNFGYLYICDHVDADYEEGLTYEQFQKIYTEMHFFDVNEHYEICQKPKNDWVTF